MIRSQERRVYETYRHITPVLPEEIVFIQSEELLREFPHRTPAERETEAARRYGAIFVIGIGGKLSDGKKHDGRAPDYDDWTTPTSGGYCGLNGDIVVWNPVLERAYEISSMGIRVDRVSSIWKGAPSGPDWSFTGRCSKSASRSLWVAA